MLFQVNRQACSSEKQYFNIVHAINEVHKQCNWEIEVLQEAFNVYQKYINRKLERENSKHRLTGKPSVCGWMKFDAWRDKPVAVHHYCFVCTHTSAGKVHSVGDLVVYMDEFYEVYEEEPSYTGGYPNYKIRPFKLKVSWKFSDVYQLMKKRIKL